MSDRTYTYAELKRMTKKRVLKIAGYRNMKHALADGINRNVAMVPGGKPVISYDKLSKKYLARIIANDKQGD